MDKNTLDHNLDWHPGIPSFKDIYKGVDNEVVNSTYGLIFLQGKKRYITGGIATQFFISPELRRGSDDIDINDLERKPWGSFKSALREDSSNYQISGFLKNYQIYLFKENHSFVVHVCNWFFAEEDKRFYFNIDFPRYSKNYHTRMLPSFQREWENAYTFDLNNVSLKVLDPVDIISRKLIRLNNYFEWEKIPCFNPPSSIEDHMDSIWEERKRLSELKGYNEIGELVKFDPRFHTERTLLRSITDSYDIRVLLKEANINQSYFEEVFSETERRLHNRSILEKILKLTSPEFSLG